MAQLLLRREQPDVARESALTAMSVFHEVQGIEEGESLSRAAYATAIRANSGRAAALREIRNAGQRLEQRADRLADLRQRESLLTGGRDDALDMQIDVEWAGELGAAEGAVELPSHQTEIADRVALNPPPGERIGRAGRRRSSPHWLIVALCALAVVAAMAVMSIFQESRADLLGAPPVNAILPVSDRETPALPSLAVEARETPAPPSLAVEGETPAPVVAARSIAPAGGAPLRPPRAPPPAARTAKPSAIRTAKPSAIGTATPIATDIMH
jgi:hypothetical protein